MAMGLWIDDLDSDGDGCPDAKKAAYAAAKRLNDSIALAPMVRMVCLICWRQMI